MKTSKRSQAIEPSLTRKLFNMALNYSDVINLTLGDPDLHPNDIIKEAACQAIKEGKTRYSANAGLLTLREELAKYIESQYAISANPTTELAVTVGGMEALFLSLSCIVDPNDEVIIFAPYYVNYIQMVRMCGGKPVIVYMQDQNTVDRNDVIKQITDRTVAIIINSPCNPTGNVISSSDLSYICDVAKERDIWIISDEVYKSLIYDNKQHHSVLDYPGARERTILIDSFSKEFCMTGWRIGYAFAPQTLIEQIVKMQENVAACAPLPSQHAAIAALQMRDHIPSPLHILQERRDFLTTAINEMPGLKCQPPKATFYLWVDISDTNMDCVAFAHRLLEEEHVAIVPGITYGENCQQFIRIAFTVDMVALKQAVERIKRFMQKHNNVRAKVQ